MNKYKITKDLIIAAMALRCPWRTENTIYASCDDGEHQSNCNPRLCTYCTDIFKDMAKIASGEVHNPLE